MNYHRNDRILEQFYYALASKDEKRIRKVHIPRSDVFYVRIKYFEDTGNWETLDKIERCMYLEGMLKSRDVLDPKRKRDWE
tara:strand:- start:1230 stop:1472 length:243 start_codon:yes stop_codon:yes gene_type:complete